MNSKISERNLVTPFTSNVTDIPEKTTHDFMTSWKGAKKTNLVAHRDLGCSNASPLPRGRRKLAHQSDASRKLTSRGRPRSLLGEKSAEARLTRVPLVGAEAGPVEQQQLQPEDAVERRDGQRQRQDQRQTAAHLQPRRPC